MIRKILSERTQIRCVTSEQALQLLEIAKKEKLCLYDKHASKNLKIENPWYDSELRRLVHMHLALHDFVYITKHRYGVAIRVRRTKGLETLEASAVLKDISTQRE